MSKISPKIASPGKVVFYFGPGFENRAQFVEIDPGQFQGARLRWRGPLPSGICPGGRPGCRRWEKIARVYSNIVAFYIIPENRIITRMVIPLSESRSPLARLVLFMFCLSVAGTFIAGVHYAAIDLPQQQSVTAPTNDYPPDYCVSFCQSVNNDLESYIRCYSECDERFFNPPMV